MTRTETGRERTQDIESAVPTIDLRSASKQADALGALDAACREHGFFLLVGHGIDAEISRMWQASEAFFNGPASNKEAIRRQQDRPLGWYDRELTKQRRDLKEVFDFTAPRSSNTDPNQWPEQPPGFKDDMSQFYCAAGALAEQTLALVYQALAFGLARTQGIEAASAGATLGTLPSGSVRTSNVRLNCYPLTDPLSAAEASDTTALGDMALHHHTDPGLLTLLLQDSVGGLQTQLRDGSWIDVPPNEQSVVVNLGDALQVLSNDRYRAAVHRVLPMGAQARFSTPFFLNPQPDAMLEPISQLCADEPKYRPFSWREYIQHRIDDNFADLGAEDTQITHYRIAS